MLKIELYNSKLVDAVIQGPSFEIGGLEEIVFLVW